MNQRSVRGTGIRKLPSGRYQITFRDGNGVKHRASFDREKDARAVQDERRTSVRNREYVAPAKIPTVESKLRGHGWRVRKFPNRSTADPSKNLRSSFGRITLTVLSCRHSVPTNWTSWIRRRSKRSAKRGNHDQAELVGTVSGRGTCLLYSKDKALHPEDPHFGRTLLGAQEVETSVSA
jgi:hypothetical protein